MVSLVYPYHVQQCHIVNLQHTSTGNLTICIPIWFVYWQVATWVELVTPHTCARGKVFGLCICCRCCWCLHENRQFGRSRHLKRTNKLESVKNWPQYTSNRSALTTSITDSAFLAMPACRSHLLIWPCALCTCTYNCPSISGVAKGGSGRA